VPDRPSKSGHVNFARAFSAKSGRGDDVSYLEGRRQGMRSDNVGAHIGRHEPEADMD